MPSLSVIVPFHRDLAALRRCLDGLAAAWISGCELLVVDDGSVEDCRSVAGRYGARTIAIANGPRGPGAARNCAARAARGDVLVFVDADVIVATDALSRIAGLLGSRRDVDAVFGAYDDAPAAPGLVSQYRNLFHAFTHLTGNHEASTFWAGLGAVRRDVFLEMGGFDERYSRPCIEDVELGYRLRARGCRVLLDRRLRGCHLKRWLLRSVLASDVRDRGIPWVRLILASRTCPADLNVSRRARLSVVSAYALALCLGAGVVTPSFWPAAAVPAVALASLNRQMFGYMRRQRGIGFAGAAFGLNFLYHITNGISVVMGTVQHVAATAAVRQRSTRHAGRAARSSPDPRSTPDPAADGVP